MYNFIFNPISILLTLYNLQNKVILMNICLLKLSPVQQDDLSWLTHWSRVTHICVSKLTIIGSYNGLSPGRRQAIIWTNAGILLIRSLGTSFSEILSEIHTFSFKKMHLNMSSGKWRPWCLGLNVLTKCPGTFPHMFSDFSVYTTVRLSDISVGLESFSNLLNSMPRKVKVLILKTV